MKSDPLPASPLLRKGEEKSGQRARNAASA